MSRMVCRSTHAVSEVMNQLQTFHVPTDQDHEKKYICIS